MNNLSLLKQAEEERKAELINQSRELIKLFGFAAGKKIGQRELEEKLELNRNRVRESLLLIYEPQNPKLASELAARREVQLAFLLNLQKMVEYGRTRTNGDPYYVHPQSVSQKILDYPPADGRAIMEGVIGALLHDYLEEGDGVSPAGIEPLRRAFTPFSPQMAEDLSLLTEPNYLENGRKQRPDLPQAINYDLLKARFGRTRKILETVIFSLMLKNSKLLQVVVPADKLDNLADCEIVQKEKAAGIAGSPEEFNALYLEKTSGTLASYLFYAENCSYPESRELRQALLFQAGQKIDELARKEPELTNLKNAVDAKLNEYRSLAGDPVINEALAIELKNYCNSLGLADFTARLEQNTLSKTG